MNPHDKLMALLQEHSFDLVRQRKHKIYRNPEGLTFVLASTPSDRRAPQNALSTLKRVLRHTERIPEATEAIPPVPIGEHASEIQAEALPVELLPATELPQPALSDQEWEAWKRQYWREEKLRAKNEVFLSLVGMYVDRASEFFSEHEGVGLGTVTDTVKKRLRDRQYKSKVLLYNCKCFEKGIVVLDVPNAPVLWASNGHIGISAFLLIDTYVQHGPSKLTTLRFDWEGTPVLLELPEKEGREFYVQPSGDTPKQDRRARATVGCPICHNRQQLPPVESMGKNQGWKCNRCGAINKPEIRCQVCKTGIIVLTELGFGYCPNCSGRPTSN